MASFNKVILIGNMVADPELKTTPTGVSVTSFRIAVGRKFTKAGETPVTDFIDIVAWRSTAEFVAKYFTKGKSILICGSLQSRGWEDKDGNKRISWEVVADEVSFVERKSADGESGSGYSQGYSQFASSPDNEAKFEEMASDDDLPF